MINEILFSGFGGQGIVTGALVMAHICLKAGMDVTNMPQYGAEQRGGAASSDTKFVAPPGEIYDPRMEHPDVLIALTEPALAQHARVCKKDAVVLFNTNMGAYNADEYPDVRIYGVPCLSLGDEAGSPKCANFVMMGAAMKLTGWFTRDFCTEQLADYFTENKREKLIDMNVKAFDLGYNYTF